MGRAMCADKWGLSLTQVKILPIGGVRQKRDRSRFPRRLRTLREPYQAVYRLGP